MKYLAFKGEVVLGETWFSHTSEAGESKRSKELKTSEYVKNIIK